MRSLYRHSIYTTIGHENIPYSDAEKKNARQPNQIRKLGFLFLICLFSLASCTIDDDIPICKGNVRIEYRYNRENTTSKNVLPMYIQSLNEYVFDEQGILRAISTLPSSSCFGKFVSEFNLPQGKYIVVTWGNISDTKQ